MSYFGRAYKITIDTQAGDHIVVSSSDFGTEALRVTFSIEQVAIESLFWVADIAIYNPSVTTGQLLGAQAPTAQTGVFNALSFNAALSKGDLVTVAAGYRASFSPDASVIFRGRVFQVMWERTDAADLVLKLRCMIGLFEDETTQCAYSFDASTTLADIVTRVASQANIPVAYLDPILSQTKLGRGQAVFSRPSLIFALIARATHLGMWNGNNGLTIRSLTPTSDQPDIVYAPPYLTDIPNAQTSTGSIKQTLVGTPQQTEQGVSFRVLLDSQLVVGQLVKLALTVTSIERKMPNPQSGLPSLLDRDGLYVAACIRHTGDTHGNEWYSTVDGVTRPFARFYAAFRQ
jgi:hypothetical protein